jgi:hypothetical protein
MNRCPTIPFPTTTTRFFWLLVVVVVVASNDVLLDPPAVSSSCRSRYLQLLLLVVGDGMLVKAEAKEKMVLFSNKADRSIMVVAIGWCVCVWVGVGGWVLFV